MKNTSGFLLRLLVDPRYRICRHILLFVLSVIILSVNFYVDVIEDSRFLVSNVIQSALLLVPIYLSVFVLTPRLLLKNKVGTYVISVVLVILLALLFSYILRKEAIEEEYELFQFWLAAFFFISIYLSFLQCICRPAYQPVLIHSCADGSFFFFSLSGKIMSRTIFIMMIAAITAIVVMFLL